MDEIWSQYYTMILVKKNVGVAGLQPIPYLHDYSKLSN